VHTLSVGLFAVNSALTFLWFAPTHQRLAANGHDAALLTRLARMNGWRTALSTARLVIVLGWMCI